MAARKSAKKRTKVSKTAFKRAILENGGNVSGIARQFSVERQTIYNYLRDWQLHDYLESARHDLFVAAEQNIYDAVIGGDTDLSKFVLTHHPQRERWSSKQEVTVGAVPLSEDALQLLKRMGLDVADVAAEFEALIRAQAEVVNG